VYSLREGRTSSNLDRHTRYSHHIFRERKREGEQGEGGKKQGGLFGGGHSNNDSIHSFTRPSLNLSFCLYPPLLLCTPSTFRKPPPPLCTLSRTLSLDLYGNVCHARSVINPNTNTNKQTGFGVGGTHPTRYY